MLSLFLSVTRLILSKKGNTVTSQHYNFSVFRLIRKKGCFENVLVVKIFRQVSIEEGDSKGREYGVMFIETSAKAGFNIKPLFRKIAAALPGMESYSNTKNEDMVDVNLKPTSNSSQGEQQGGGCSC